MRKAVACVLGAALILAAVGVNYTSRFMSPGTVGVVSLHTSHGRAAFALVLNEWTWWGLTGQKRPANEPLSDHAEGEIRKVINRALEASGQHCPDRWLLSAVKAIPDDHEIWVAGYCATPAELAND